LKHYVCYLYGYFALYVQVVWCLKKLHGLLSRKILAFKQKNQKLCFILLTLVPFVNFNPSSFFNSSFIFVSLNALRRYVS
jgi:uncharacterized membrane protein YdjX (TVP38/TMEM64 family)